MSDLHYKVNLVCGNCRAIYEATVPKKQTIDHHKPPCSYCGCYFNPWLHVPESPSPHPQMCGPAGATGGVVR